MKKIFNLSLIVWLLFITAGAKAQTYEVPKNVAFHSKDDYFKYEPDLLKTIDWLQQTPWTEQADKRKEANAFVLMWITGSPYVNLDLNEKITQLCDKNPHC